MSSTECLDNYRNSVRDSEQYMQKAYITDNNGNYIYDEDYRTFIADAAFLKFFKAWESFLENIFSSFIMGEPTTANTTVVSFINPRDDNHSRRILVGVNKYLDWANPDIVKKLSKLYLEENNTIEHSISSSQTDISDLRTIRNAAAHLTTTTQKPLDSLASRLMGHQQVNMTPSKLIQQIKPETTKTFWEYYKEVMDITVENIARGDK